MLSTYLKTGITSLLICFTTATVHAQDKKIPVTDHFTIEGKVKHPLTVSFAELKKMKPLAPKNIVIYNHLMEKKKEIRQVTGVSLKELLTQADIDEEMPKNLSEYYITCIAEDGYQVVFSWNELFNTKAGGQVIIITGEDGKSLDHTNDHIALLSPGDIATGRRYVKGLSRIVVGQVGEVK